MTARTKASAKREKITPPKVDRRTPEEKKVDAAIEKALEQIEQPKDRPKRQYRHHAPEDREAIYAAMRRKTAKESQEYIHFALSKKKEKSLIEYVKKQENKSAFFRRLIIQDMQENELKAKKEVPQKKKEPS